MEGGAMISQETYDSVAKTKLGREHPDELHDAILWLADNRPEKLDDPGYLYSALKSRVIDAHRRSQRHGETILPRPPEDDPLARAMLHEAHDQLTAEQQAAYDGCVLLGQTTSEVAQVLGVSRSTVWRWLHEARRGVAKYYA